MQTRFKTSSLFILAASFTSCTLSPFIFNNHTNNQSIFLAQHAFAINFETLIKSLSIFQFQVPTGDYHEYLAINSRKTWEQIINALTINKALELFGLFRYQSFCDVIEPHVTWAQWDHLAKKIKTDAAFAEKIEKLEHGIKDYLLDRARITNAQRIAYLYKPIDQKPSKSLDPTSIISSKRENIAATHKPDFAPLKTDHKENDKAQHEYRYNLYYIDDQGRVQATDDSGIKNKVFASFNNKNNKNDTITSDHAATLQSESTATKQKNGGRKLLRETIRSLTIFGPNYQIMMAASETLLNKISALKEALQSFSPAHIWCYEFIAHQQHSNRTEFNHLDRLTTADLKKELDNIPQALWPYLFSLYEHQNFRELVQKLPEYGDIIIDIAQWMKQEKEFEKYLKSFNRGCSIYKNVAEYIRNEAEHITNKRLRAQRLAQQRQETVPMTQPSLQKMVIVESPATETNQCFARLIEQANALRNDSSFQAADGFTQIALIGKYFQENGHQELAQKFELLSGLLLDNTQSLTCFTLNIDRQELLAMREMLENDLTQAEFHKLSPEIIASINQVNQFIDGLLQGTGDSIEATINLLSHPEETALHTLELFLRLKNVVTDSITLANPTLSINKRQEIEQRMLVRYEKVVETCEKMIHLCKTMNAQEWGQVSGRIMADIASGKAIGATFSTLVKNSKQLIPLIRQSEKFANVGNKLSHRAEQAQRLMQELETKLKQSLGLTEIEQAALANDPNNLPLSLLSSTEKEVIKSKPLQNFQLPAAIIELFKDIPAACAKLDPSLGNIKKIEEMLLALKDIPGAQTTNSPIAILLQCGKTEASNKLSTAMGALYEVEKAYELLRKGEKIVQLGGKRALIEHGILEKVLEIDIETSTKLIECKNWNWSLINASDGFRNFKEQITRLKRLSIKISKALEIHSKHPIPISLKEWLKTKNITFFEE